MSAEIDVPPILLAVDANVLLGLALRQDTPTPLGDVRLRLLVAEYTFAEFRRHVPRRVRERARANNLDANEADLLHDTALTRGEAYTRRITLDAYQRYEAEACRRIPDDPDDWHTAALAYGAAIWTEDKHFWGCGIAVWTTHRLLTHLAAN